MYKTDTLEPVTTKEFEQSLFVMLAMVTIVLLGAYFTITYNAPIQAETVPEITYSLQGNGTLTWNIDGIQTDTIIQIEAQQGNNWLLVGTNLAANGQLALPSTAQEFRIVVKDADGNVLQESIVN